MNTTTTIDEFMNEAEKFASISEKICDGWTLVKHEDLLKSFLRKETFIKVGSFLLKAEYIVFYNLSYGVPAFSFNVWNCSGRLLTLNEVRQMGVTMITQKDFYSVITQQDHPIFSRPYFIVHPCHTEALLAIFKDKTRNIIVTFLGLIVPLLPQLNLSAEYGM